MLDNSGGGGGGGGEDSVPIVANIDINSSLDKVLFEDELSYNYSLLSNGGITLTREGQNSSKPVGNKVVNITGQVSPAHFDDCHKCNKTLSIGANNFNRAKIIAYFIN